MYVFRVREQGSRGRAGREVGADPAAVGESHGGRHHGAGRGGEESAGGARATLPGVREAVVEGVPPDQTHPQGAAHQDLCTGTRPKLHVSHRYTAKTTCVSQVHSQNYMCLTGTQPKLHVSHRYTAKTTCVSQVHSQNYMCLTGTQPKLYVSHRYTAKTTCVSQVHGQNYVSHRYTAKTICVSQVHGQNYMCLKVYKLFKNLILSYAGFCF